MVGKRRRPGGNSLSDLEEAFLKRRLTESSTASPTTRDRHYDSLRTPRPSSMTSVNENAGSGHQFYLASLSQRLQIELYIVVSQSLTHVSKSTKHTLNRLGVFTVSSFHVYTCARSPSLLNSLLAGRSATRRRAVAVANSPSSRKSRRRAEPHHAGDGGEKQFRVNLPDGQTATVHLKDNMSVEENHFVPHHPDLIDSYVPSHELMVDLCGKALY